MESNSYNILMYSHDTYGLGHIRRTMAIARNLVRPGVNILIVTGSPIVGRYTMPKGVDFVRMPGMIKKSNTVYVPHSIKVDPKIAIAIRKNIILSTAKAFKPDLFIVDKVPAGLKGEVLPTLKWIKGRLPCTRVVLGLRDILDDAASTRAEWEKKKYFEILRDLYSEIWVYGEKELYDPIKEYAFPEDIAAKTVFTGYIPRKVPGARKLKRKHKQVVVTIGGGGDGYVVLDNYLKMLETNGVVDFKTLMITGPFLPPAKLDELADRARAVKVQIKPFFKNIEKRMANADLVVTMGGYNTLCEILSLKKPALVIPRDKPRQEQLLRAQVFQGRGLCDFIRWGDVTPELLRQKVSALLDDPGTCVADLEEFCMTGLEVMCQRLAHFRENCP
ncbi:MAG: glycosyltransferase [Pseudodesulfovibrio sp.]|uniref:Glycosyltransferase 28 domain protein n=1 Tax=Pseudodesulfovibrio aespoeensis (strain ATCC 700646 / DSM 10631 / Aspo-2) TaxID=643562 RepID=E6VWD0_PSEA9|nr:MULTISPECIES: glycosyltransferase [Pseudodesulfovibrio]MBU4192854.1 glycosyltransferase [Pseudomonadota bacterium]ADU61336.1 Glycosyltransferase 28 domain protein [Pseudodesulfovibrio aespoeensis Aspo-2]MBU4243169.1 glycosyltransferase [Pseudomonadota bacterium]MBU4378176.1 glycosyltransferase [Pseudomonadota bacterium]MBU4475638.1 glycosyltransferase [Pseudomonadota bacterium]